MDEGYTSQLDSRGPYICEACGENFVEMRYRIKMADGDVHIFCTPECFVGYDYYVLGHWQDDEEAVNISKQTYQHYFGRYVVPTPLSVLMRQDTRKRSQWLFEACRRVDQLRPEDKARADMELKLTQ